jgi:hypothetical protein
MYICTWAWKEGWARGLPPGSNTEWGLEDFRRWYPFLILFQSLWNRVWTGFKKKTKINVPVPDCGGMSGIPNRRLAIKGSVETVKQGSQSHPDSGQMPGFEDFCLVFARILIFARFFPVFTIWTRSSHFLIKSINNRAKNWKFFPYRGKKLKIFPYRGKKLKIFPYRGKKLKIFPYRGKKLKIFPIGSKKLKKMPGFCPDFGLKLPGFARFLTFFARIRSEGPGNPGS